jgi:class 3 adenylate cyclase
MSVREALDGLAAIAVRTGDLARACRLAATAEAVCDLRREPADDLIRERLLGSLPAAALAGRDVRSNERLTTAEIDATLVEIAAQASDIELFDRIERPGGRVERVTVTLLLTDIVDSTRRAVALGDAAWLQLSDAHVAASRRALDRHDGTEAKNTGDGLLASFDRPTDAIRCAQAINEATRQLGLDIRTGVHLAECDVLNDDVRGIAVHVVARVCALAGAGEVLVTQPVRDLIDGELGIECASRGRTELRGLPGGWELFEMR